MLLAWEGVDPQQQVDHMASLLASSRAQSEHERYLRDRVLTDLRKGRPASYTGSSRETTAYGLGLIAVQLPCGGIAWGGEGGFPATRPGRSTPGPVTNESLR
jgi:hypothetical protein